MSFSSWRTTEKAKWRKRSSTWHASGKGGSRCACSAPWPLMTSWEACCRRAEMNLLTLLLRLPFVPLRGFVQLAAILHEQAERELRDPASVRRQLEEAQEAHVSGEMSDDDLVHVEGQAVGR